MPETLETQEEPETLEPPETLEALGTNPREEETPEGRIVDESAQRGACRCDAQKVANGEEGQHVREALGREA